MATDDAPEREPTSRPEEPGPPEWAAAPRARGIARTTPLVVAGVIGLVFATAAIAWHSTPGHVVPNGMLNLSHGAGGVETVELDGFNGRLSVGVDGLGRIAATAQPASDGGAPAPAFRLNPATHVLTLSCSGPGTATVPAAACPPGDYAVLVPPGVGVTLHELSGQATLTGLSGPVTITASSADTTAVALDTAAFTATITSGTLDASFASAPARVAVSVISAQAALRLPGTVAYAVRQQSISADIQVALPRSAASAHTVLATATSGSIDLTTGG